jgi:hypothetical protein
LVHPVVANCKGRRRNGDVRKTAGNEEEKVMEGVSGEQNSRSGFLTSNVLRIIALLFKATVAEDHKSECRRQLSETNIALFTLLN